VNYGPRFNFLYIALPFYYYSLCLLYLHYYYPFSTRYAQSFVYSKTVRLTTSSQVGSKVLGCVVCRFHVAASEKLHADKQLIWRPCPECREASKHHLLKCGFLLLVRLNLGFTTEGRLATVLIIPSSWSSQRAVLTHHQPVFWCRCRGGRRLL
jgi:hypothetical protein